MSIIDKFLDTMKLNDDDFDEEEEAEEESEDEESSYDEDEEEAPRYKLKSKKAAKEEPRMAKTAARSGRPNVVPIRQSRDDLEVCMIKPASISDAREIVDTLLSGRAVVINMEGIPTETAQKIIDFTSGAAYSINGNLQKISNFIFICTPPSVELSGDFEEIVSEMTAF